MAGTDGFWDDPDDEADDQTPLDQLPTTDVKAHPAGGRATLYGGQGIHGAGG